LSTEGNSNLKVQSVNASEEYERVLESLFEYEDQFNGSSTMAVKSLQDKVLDSALSPSDKAFLNQLLADGELDNKITAFSRTVPEPERRFQRELVADFQRQDNFQVARNAMEKQFENPVLRCWLVASYGWKHAWSEGVMVHYIAGKVLQGVALLLLAIVHVVDFVAHTLRGFWSIFESYNKGGQRDCLCGDKGCWSPGPCMLSVFFRTIPAFSPKQGRYSGNNIKYDRKGRWEPSGGVFF
jgi:hypothetical protein